MPLLSQQKIFVLDDGAPDPGLDLGGQAVLTIELLAYWGIWEVLAAKRIQRVVAVLAQRGFD